MSVEHHLALPPGTRLQNYCIESVLGQGGFGITYLAHDEALDMKVAIKEYLPGSLATRDTGTNLVHVQSGNMENVFNWGLTRFLDEARTLASLSHPHIVRVMNFLSLNGTGYMIMEFEEGEDLAERLKRRSSPPSEAEIRQLLSPMIDALRIVHKVGLIHRDIKPDNIYLRRNGEPVLIDFGAARNLLSGKSQTLAAIVSHGYSPNEQYSDLAKQGPWTDIYALAAVVYRMITGDPPPEAPVRADHHIANLPDPLTRLTQIRPPGFSEAFLAGIDQALNLAQKERPQSVDEWRTQLDLDKDSAIPGNQAPQKDPQHRDNMRGDETAVLPLSSSERSPGTDKSSAWLLPAIAALLIATLAGGGGYWWYMQPSSDLIGDSPAEAFPLGPLGVMPHIVADHVGGSDPGDFISFRLDETMTVTLKSLIAAPGIKYQLQDQQGTGFEFYSKEDVLLAELAAGSYHMAVRSPGHRSRYEIELSATRIDKNGRPGENNQTALDLSAQPASGKDAYSYSGIVWPHQKEHFLKFNIANPRTVDIETRSAGSPLSLTLNNHEGVAVKSRSLSATDNLPLSMDLAPGTYFIVLNSRQKKAVPYDINVRLGAFVDLSKTARTSDMEEGGSFESARSLGTLSASTKRFSSGSKPEQAQQFFRFTTKAQGTTLISAQADTSLMLELFDANKRSRLAATPGDQKKASIKKHLQTGTYVLRLTSPGAKTVHLEASHTAGKAPGTTRVLPVELGLVTGQALHHRGKLSKDHARNYFAFTLDQAQQVVLQLKAGSAGNRPPFTLKLSEPERQKEMLFEIGANESLSKKLVLEKGHYLAEIEARPGDVSLPFNAEIYALDKLPVDEAGETAGDARTVEIGPSGTKHLAGFVGGRDRADWYRVKTLAGGILTARLRGLSQNADLLLRKQDGAYLDGSRLEGHSEENLSWKTDGSPLFLEVRGAADWPTSYLLELETNPGQHGSPAKRKTPATASAAGLWNSTAQALLTNGATRAETETAAKILARSRLVSEALKSGAILPRTISGSKDSARLLEAMEKAITLDENWQVNWQGEQKLQVALQARFRVVNERQTLSASLFKKRFKAMEKISLKAGAKEPFYLAVFAWQADGTILRLIPAAPNDHVFLSANQKIDLPRDRDQYILSAPLPGRNQSHEALIVTGCPTIVDYGKLAPVGARSVEGSLATAVNNRVFIERLANACKKGLSLRVLPYVVYNEPS